MGIYWLGFLLVGLILAITLVGVVVWSFIGWAYHWLDRRIGKLICIKPCPWMICIENTFLFSQRPPRTSEERRRERK